MSENQVNTSPAPVAEEALNNTVTAAPIATDGKQEKTKNKAFIVGQTIGFGIPEDLVSPTEVWEGLSAGPVDNPNVTLTMEYTTPPVDLTKRTDLKGNSEMMFFFSERGTHVDERIRAFVSPKALRNGDGANWNESLIAAAMRSAYIDDRLANSTKREGSSFKQYLETENAKLGFTAPKIVDSGAASYTGEKAVQRVRAIMGLGGMVSVPLWHSGFWITLTAPSESAVIELNRRLQEEKIEKGRETFGLVFSNEQSYLNAWLLDFCFEHIFDHTVKVDKDELRSLIKIQDLPILFWGIGCLIWPRGFDYIRSITSREGIENMTTISARLNMGKLMWVDNASFDDKHRAHMTKRQRGIMTVESVKEYQDTFIPALAGGRRVQIRENLEVIIDSTNVSNYIADGENWIAGIVSTVDSTFTQSAPTPQERNRMIDTHARASVLRNNGAWVKAIIIDGNENTSREDICEMLDILSMDEEATELLNKEINKFKDDSTRALIAIPETSGKEIGLPRFPHLIPLDVVNTFFTLLAQRVDIIRRR